MAVTSCHWEGNRRSGVALAMHHRLKWFSHIRAQGLSKRDEHPTNTPHKVWYSLPLPVNNWRILLEHKLYCPNVLADGNYGIQIQIREKMLEFSSVVLAKQRWKITSGKLQRTVITQSKYTSIQLLLQHQVTGRTSCLQKAHATYPINA